jgi:phosphate:Na+ symporter
MQVLRKLLLPVIVLLLVYGIWLSPEFQQVAAGVAIFLFGVLALEEGFRTFSGGLLERFLKKSTDRLWKSLNFGLVTTTLMQSSSLVSVLTISFLSASLISLAAGIGIIYGANLGTTTGAWLVAGFGLKVKLSAYAMPMLIFGILLIFQKPPVIKGVGYALSGIGFLFLGIQFMKDGFEIFQDSLDLSAYALSGYAGLFLYVLLGILATVIMQSSHATLVLIITALASGHIIYTNALALAIGANIGTTITAIIASLGANIAGKRLAGAHFIFNIVTGLIAILFISQFIYMVDLASLHLGIADHDYTLKLALFHTMFNLTGVILMLPFVNPMVVFLQKVMPERPVEVEKPKYLNEAALESPDAAVEVVRNETMRLYDLAIKIIANGIGLRKKDLLSDRPLEELDTVANLMIARNIDNVYGTRIKSVYSSILDFIVRARNKTTGPQNEALRELSGAGHHIIEAVKGVKHLQKNLLVYIGSINPDMVKIYKQLQVQIGHVIRTIEEARNMESETESVLSLDYAILTTEQDNQISENHIEDLIRDKKITPEMATSLMNDIGYTRSICSSLITMAKYLFASPEQGLRQAERNLELEHHELDSIISDENK